MNDNDEAAYYPARPFPICYPALSLFAPMLQTLLTLIDVLD